METHVLHFTPQPPWWHSRRVWALLSVFLLLLILLGTWITYLPSGELARGVQVGVTSVDRHTLAQASLVLSQQPVPEYRITVTRDEEPMVGEWSTSSTTLGLHWDIQTALAEAQSIGRRGTIFQQAWERVSGYWHTTVITLPLEYEESALNHWLAELNQTITVAGEHPQATLAGSGVNISPGKYGHRVDEPTLRNLLTTGIGQEKTVEVPIEVTHVPLSPDGLTYSQDRLKKLRTVSLELRPSEQEAPVSLAPAQYFPWLILPDGYNTEAFSTGIQKLVHKWERSPTNAEFAYDASTEKVTTFIPHQTGRGVLMEPLVEEVVARLQTRVLQPTDTSWSPVIPVPFVETQPERTLESMNTLGIKELIGYGTSRFKGSIPGRVHNVGHTSERISLTLVPPGKEFSFNAELGEVSGKTGFQQAYVIRNGRTELGDGGGVCQVSTTLFRAVLNAGLPITQWKAHSYRVGYYEQGSQPGFDATVYAPSVDLRFRNDTDHAIVVRALADKENTFLAVELWGTKDGRVSEISGYKMWNQRPAPPTLYQDDPSLPAGVRKQVDWSAPGASTSFHYRVTNSDGSPRFERDFVSHFKPWQAVFLVGTGQ